MPRSCRKSVWLHWAHAAAEAMPSSTARSRVRAFTLLPRLLLHLLSGPAAPAIILCTCAGNRSRQWHCSVAKRLNLAALLNLQQVVVGLQAVGAIGNVRPAVAGLARPEDERAIAVRGG